MKPIVYTISPYRRESNPTKRRYVLEPYSSQVRRTSEPDYNIYNHTFRPITPPYQSQQIPHEYFSSYEDPRAHYFDTDQSQVYLPAEKKLPHHVLAYRRNMDLSSTSESDLSMDKSDRHAMPTSNTGQSGQSGAVKRRRLLHNIYDFIAIAATCIIFALIYFLISPVQRGFYCDDISIQYPYKPDTVPMWMLAIYGGITPIIVIIIVEFWVVRPFNCNARTDIINVKQRRIDYLKTVLQTLLLFALGVAVCFFITEVGKRTIGRLRPYYITVCNPLWNLIQCTKLINTSTGQITIPLYVMDHHCNTTVSAKDLREARLSFPSGHSSYSTYAFVFLVVYFEARLVCPKFQFLKPFLQCICIAVAFFTCLSRVTDHKHHASDVIGGAIIGFSIAVFTAVRIGTYLWSLSIYCDTIEETKKDRLPFDQRTYVPGIETDTSGQLRTHHDIPLQDMEHPYHMSSAYSENTGAMRQDQTVGVAVPKKHIPKPNSGGTRRIAPSSITSEPND